MKNIIDYIKSGESFGRIFLGRSTGEDKERCERTMANGEIREEDILKDFTNDDYIKQKVNFLSQIDMETAWVNFKSRLSPVKNLYSKRALHRKIVVMAAASVAAAILLLDILLPDDEGGNSPLGEDAHLILSKYTPGKAFAQLKIGIDMDTDSVIRNGDSLGNDDFLYSIDVDADNFQAVANAFSNETSGYNRLIVPLGNEFHFTMPDGSEVWMNSDSEIIYCADNKEVERNIFLKKGEVYFKVTPDSRRPFKVHCPGHTIEALGTEFNIAAYDDSPFIYTTLVEGSVKLSLEDDSRRVEILDHVGRQCMVDRSDNSVSIRDVDIRTSTGWKEGFFVFNNASLLDVMKTLSRWYDFEFDITDSALYDYHFTGEFNRFGDLEQVFEVIRFTDIPFKLSFDGKKVIIRQSS